MGEVALGVDVYQTKAMQNRLDRLGHARTTPRAATHSRNGYRLAAIIVVLTVEQTLERAGIAMVILRRHYVKSIGLGDHLAVARVFGVFIVAIVGQLELAGVY